MDRYRAVWLVAGAVLQGLAPLWAILYVRQRRIPWWLYALLESFSITGGMGILVIYSTEPNLRRARADLFATFPAFFVVGFIGISISIALMRPLIAAYGWPSKKQQRTGSKRKTDSDTEIEGRDGFRA